MRKVFVTGLGFVTSIGNNKSSVTKSLRELKHGIELFPFFENNDKIPIRVAGTIKEFDTTSQDPEDWAYPTSLKLRMDVLRGLAPHGLYAFYAMEQALHDAKLTAEAIGEDPRTGLFTASGGSIVSIYHLLNMLFEKGVMRCPPTGIIRSVVGTLSFTLTAAYKIKGASTGFSSACASSGHALGYAFNEITSGAQDRMIVVGGEDCTLESILPFAGLRVLSTSKDPNKASRPFDRDRDGFVGTGGSVAMVLESEELALKRQSPIYAEFLGWGQATDGYHPTKPHPDGIGLVGAMRHALHQSKINPSDVDYINAHATGTSIGDLAEIQAIKTLFPTSSKRPAISSTKALTGHPLSCASVMEAAFTVLSMKEGFIPGSANIENLIENAQDLWIPLQSIKGGANVAMSNSSGFGGANVSIIFKKHR